MMFNTLREGPGADPQRLPGAAAAHPGHDLYMYIYIYIYIYVLAR